MKVVIFGANGGVGRCLVAQALDRQWQVTAAVRDPARFGLSHERLRVMACDVENAASVAHAVVGQDAVLCALGTDARGPLTLYSTGARHVVAGMQAHGVRRVVFLSNFGVLDERSHDLRGVVLLFLARLLIRETLADHRRALDVLRASALEWIAVRPMALTNGPRTGDYRVAMAGLPPKGIRIARADVADFMLQQASSDGYVGQVPGIAY